MARKRKAGGGWRGKGKQGAHRDDEDGTEAASLLSPGEQVAGRVPGGVPQPRRGLAGPRVEALQQRIPAIAGWPDAATGLTMASSGPDLERRAGGEEGSSCARGTSRRRPDDPVDVVAVLIAGGPWPA